MQLPSENNLVKVTSKCRQIDEGYDVKKRDQNDGKKMAIRLQNIPYIDGDPDCHFDVCLMSK